jgi:hypothetical protein
MLGKGKTRFGVVALLMVATAAVPSAVGLMRGADEEWDYRSRTAKVPKKSEATVSRSCENNAPRVVGGGGAITGSGPRVALTGFGPTGPVLSEASRSFETSGRNRTGEPQELRTLVICESPISGRELSYLIDDDNTTDGLDARSMICPEGSTLAGGGVRITDGRGLIRGSGPNPGGDQRSRSWRSSVEALDGTIEFETVAICHDGAFDGSQPRKTEDVPGLSTGTAKVRCPDGANAVLSGGTSSVDFRTLSSLPYDSKDEGSRPDGWKVKAYNASIGTEQLDVIAVCFGD